MTTLFWYLADAAFAAGWVVLVLCLFRLLCKKYLPRWLAVVMWALVAVRLVCPFSIESDMSVMPEPLSYTVNTYWEETVTAPTQAAPPVTVPDVPVSDALPEAFAIPWEAIACGVWLVGVFAMLGYMVISYVSLRNRVRTATKRDGNLYECETVETPFILGVLHPRIYLPYDMSDVDRGHALAHERAHIARGDHLWKFAAFVLLSVYWFHPLLWVAYILFCRDIEFACDEKVIKHLSQDERKTYSHALLSSALSHHRAVLCPLAFGEVGVEARVKTVMKYKKPLRTLVVIFAIACAVFAWWLITDPPSPSRATLDGAYVHVLYEDDTISERDAILVEQGNRVSLHGEDSKPLQLVIEEVDTEDMTVTVSFSQKMYRQSREGRRITVGLGEQERLSTARDGGGELLLTLALPSSAAQADDKNERETVYIGDDMVLRLHEQYYSLQLDKDNTIYGTYEQTDDTLTLTQDAYLTQYVFRADGDGWRYDAAASYRHKQATSPVLADGAALAYGYRYEHRLVNQHYQFTVFGKNGETLFKSHSAYGVKPTLTLQSSIALCIKANIPAVSPSMKSCILNLHTGGRTDWEVVS